MHINKIKIKIKIFIKKLKYYLNYYKKFLLIFTFFINLMKHAYK